MNKEVAVEARKMVASHLKKRREELKMTQDELAEKMGIKKAAISRMENGLYPPSLDMFFEWCHHLNLYFFVEGKESKEENATWFRNRWGKPSEN